MKRLALALGFLVFIASPAFATVAPTDESVIPALKETAVTGDMESEIKIGLFYKSVYPKDGADFVEAAKWLKMAADQGNAEAQNALGDLYFHGGHGVKQDSEEAYFWFILAAQGGDKAYEADRDDTATRLPAAKAAEVKKRADDWKPEAQDKQEAPKTP